eukprot:3395143-Lingulodinium_polyedra.AAC.1
MGSASWPRRPITARGHTHAPRAAPSCSRRGCGELVARRLIGRRHALGRARGSAAVPSPWPSTAATVLTPSTRGARCARLGAVST